MSDQDAPTTYDEAATTYEELSESFTELNKTYNTALRTDSMTDELELAFLRAERALHAAYKTRQQLKAAELQED